MIFLLNISYNSSKKERKTGNNKIVKIMATVKQQLQYLIDNKIAVISMEPWGTGARQFVKIGGKKAQYNGHRINNSLEKIIKTKYIEEAKPMSSKNKKQAEIIQNALKKNQTSER